MAYAPIVGADSRKRHAAADITLSASNTTASVDVFTLTGSVLIHAIWAEVTTLIGANHTAGFIRLDDGSAQVVITAASGVTISAFEAGSLMVKEGLAATALTGLQADQIRLSEPAAAGDPALQACIVTADAAATSNIEYRYSTTDTPTTGVLRWHAIWEPLSDDGDLS